MNTQEIADLFSKTIFWNNVEPYPGKADGENVTSKSDAAFVAKLPTMMPWLLKRAMAADAMLAACKAWVEYFDRLCRDDEPGDPMAEARKQYHAYRVEQTRAAISMAEGGAK